jgi:hypothetical protein
MGADLYIYWVWLFNRFAVLVLIVVKKDCTESFLLPIKVAEAHYLSAADICYRLQNSQANSHRSKSLESLSLFSYSDPICASQI